VVDTADASAGVGAVVGGKYMLKSLIGTGGMGAVYEAENTWTRRPVALKLLHPAFANSREVVERFMQEAQLASQIRHPNIVDVLDLGQEPSDNSLFIVQELLHGNDLRTLLDASGRLDVPTAIDIALPLMGALAVAHRRGVVHRDIKPENIFLAHDDSGEVVPKLIDFGISKIATDAPGSRNLTQSGTLVGTPNYMSPEQARGDAQIDGRSDVWSLGVVLYEMLSGCVPFDAPNQNVLMVKIIMEQAPRIETVAPDVHPALAAIVHGALVNDREGRFSDMPAFIAAVLQSGLWGPELFERHRRSLSISAEISGHLQAIARAGAQHTPTHVAPSRPTPSTLAPPMTQPEYSAMPRVPPPSLTNEAVFAGTRQEETAPLPAGKPMETPVAWSPQEATADVASGAPRWVVALVGAATIVLVVVAGAVWLQGSGPRIVTPPTPATNQGAVAPPRQTTPIEPPQTPVTPSHATLAPPPIAPAVMDAGVATQPPRVVARPGRPPAGGVIAPPTASPPPVRAPAVGAPGVRAPAVGAPVVRTPAVGAPVVRTPVVRTPGENSQNGAPILGL
jgi:serine/threonine protein kinase